MNTDVCPCGLIADGVHPATDHVRAHLWLDNVMMPVTLDSSIPPGVMYVVPDSSLSPGVATDQDAPSSANESATTRGGFSLITEPDPPPVFGALSVAATQVLRGPANEQRAQLRVINGSQRRQHEFTVPVGALPLILTLIENWHDRQVVADEWPLPVRAFRDPGLRATLLPDVRAAVAQQVARDDLIATEPIRTWIEARTDNGAWVRVENGDAPPAGASRVRAVARTRALPLPGREGE